MDHSSNLTVLSNLYAQLGPLIERVNAINEELQIIKTNLSGSIPSQVIGQKRSPPRMASASLKRRRLSSDCALLLLPDEILLKILRLLDVHSLLMFSVTCKGANFLANEEMLWFPFNCKYFGKLDCVTFPPKLNDNIISVFSCRASARQNWIKHRYQKASLTTPVLHNQAHMHPLDCDRVFISSKSGITEMNIVTGMQENSFESPSNCVDFCVDPERLYISGTDIVRVYNRISGDLIYPINDILSNANRLKVSSSHLVAGLWDGNIKVFNPINGNLLHSIPGHKSPIHSLSFASDIIATGSSDRTIKLWSLQGKLLSNLTDHIKTVSTIHMCKGASTMVSGSKDCSIKLWDVETSKCINTYSNPVELTTIAWRGENLFLSGDGLGNIFMRDTRIPEPVNSLKGHTSSITALTLSEKKVVSCDSARRLFIWDFSQLVPMD